MKNTKVAELKEQLKKFKNQYSAEERIYNKMCNENYKVQKQLDKNEQAQSTILAKLDSTIYRTLDKINKLKTNINLKKYTENQIKSARKILNDCGFNVYDRKNK